jgi:hypothetical protein
MNSHKSSLKLQLIESVAPSEETLRLLHEDPTIRSTADYRAKLRLGRIAERANDDALSLDLLSSATEDLRSEEDLAAELANDLSEFELLERILVLFPGSLTTFDMRLRLYLRTRRYSDLLHRLLSNEIAMDLQRRFFFLTLASAFASGEPVDFSLLLDTVSSAAPELTGWCRLVCGNEVIARSDFTKQLISACRRKAGL